MLCCTGHHAPSSLPENSALLPSLPEDQPEAAPAALWGLGYTEQCPGSSAAWFCRLLGAVLKLPLIYLYPVEERWSLAKSPLSAVKGGQKAFKETSLVLDHSQLFCMWRQKKHRCCEGYEELPLQGLPENPSVLGLYQLEAEKQPLPQVIWGAWARGRQSSCRDSSSLTPSLTAVFAAVSLLWSKSTAVLFIYLFCLNPMVLST